jgi:hypothetical protein
MVRPPKSRTGRLVFTLSYLAIVDYLLHFTMVDVDVSGYERWLRPDWCRFTVCSTLGSGSRRPLPAAEAVGYVMDRSMRICISDFLARK